MQVFIVYGGRQGEKIGRRVEVYFKANNIGAFLASPLSSDMNPYDELARIDRELKTANLAIIVVTNGTSSSKYALEEIDRIVNELNYPCIPFVRRGVSPPRQLRDKWNVYFNHDFPRKPELVELELKMWRYYDQWQIRQIKQVSEGEKVEPKAASALEVE